MGREEKLSHTINAKTTLSFLARFVLVVILAVIFMVIVPRQSQAAGSITSVAPNTDLIAGTSRITINGSGFGTDGYVDYNCPPPYNALCWDLYPTTYSDTQIVSLVQADAISGPIFVHSYSNGDSSSYFVYLKPTISNFTTESEVYSDSGSIGSTVTISGTNFTDTPGKVFFNGLEGTVQTWTNTQIKSVIPTGATDGKILVKLFNQNSSTYDISVESSDTLYVYPPLSNDPLASNNQWWISQIKTHEVWNTTTGSSNVIVAVIDSGVDTNHYELTNNIWSNSDEIAGNGKDDDGNGYVDDTHGWDFTTNSPELSPWTSHGTHVAGIIAATGNNSAGVASIAWSTRIMPVIVLNRSGGTTANIVKAIKYAVDNGANIINLSLGGSGFTTDYSSSFDEAISYAFARNVVVIAAAGNGDYTGSQPRNLDVNPSSPVCNDGNRNMVIGVAATNPFDNKADFSDYGVNCIDVSAPGTDIFSTVRPIDDPAYTSSYDPRFIGYDQKSGTSMAAPMVSGLAALLKSKYPQANAPQIFDMIRKGTDNIDSLNPQYVGKIGTGRINIVKTLSLSPDPNIGLPDLIPPTLPTGARAYSSAARELQLNFDSQNSYPRPIFEFLGATDNNGVKGYFVKLSTSQNDDAHTGSFQTSNIFTPTFSTTGTNYIHVRTVDNSDNESGNGYWTFKYLKSDKNSATIDNPLIKSVAVRNGQFSISSKKKIRPFGLTEDKIWGKKIDFGPSGQIFIFGKIAGSGGNLKIYNSSGKLLKNEKPFGKRYTKELRTEIIFDQFGSRMLLATSQKENGRYVKVYQVTGRGISLLSQISTGGKGDTLIKFLKPYSDRLSLFTGIKGKSKTYKIWSVPLAGKTFLLDREFVFKRLSINRDRIFLK